jgi:hypothetical protein
MHRKVHLSIPIGCHEVRHATASHDYPSIPMISIPVNVSVAVNTAKAILLCIYLGFLSFIIYRGMEEHM